MGKPMIVCNFNRCSIQALYCSKTMSYKSCTEISYATNIHLGVMYILLKGGVDIKEGWL